MYKNGNVSLGMWEKRIHFNGKHILNTQEKTNNNNNINAECFIQILMTNAWIIVIRTICCYQRIQ